MLKQLKAVSVSLTLLLAVSAIAGCGGGNGAGNKEDSDEKIDVRIFTYSGDDFDSVNMDSVMKEIEKKVNVGISFEGAEESDYYTKLSPMIGSLDLPDIIWSDPENSGGAFQNWADPKKELLYNLDDFLIGHEDRYPYLNKLVYSDQYKNISYYDGHYIVPMVQTLTAWAIYYRADWLKAIGFVDEEGNAKAPVTLDEFEEVMQKFSGTGLFPGMADNRTYGLSPNTQNFYVNPLYGAFGITPDWDIDEDGEVSYMYARESFKPYLEWMHAMYEKGFIDPVFNQNTGFQDRQSWYNGKVGCIMTNGEGHMAWLLGESLKYGAENVIVGPPLLGTGNTSKITGCKLGVKGERGFSNWGGYYGGYAVTQGTKNPWKCLDLLEYLISPEGSMLRLYGIEGKHYDIVDGEIVPNLDGREDETFQYFETVKDESGKEEIGGLHKMGSRFGYNLDWDYFEETHQIRIATDIASLYPSYSKIMSEALGYTEYLQTSKLTNVTAYPAAISTKMSEVMREATRNVNASIIDGKIEENWSKMLTTINAMGYEQVKAVIKETAETLGIVG